MNKRGQVTVFVIIGIILIILILLFLFLRNKVSLGSISQQNIEDQLPQIKKHIEDCLVEIGEPRLRQIGLQGGVITTPEDTYRLYNSNKVSYLCYNIKDQPYCRSKVLRLKDIETEVDNIIQKDLQTRCLNINAFQKRGYELTQGQLGIKTSINDDSILIEADLPIVIRRGEAVVKESKFASLIKLLKNYIT